MSSDGIRQDFNFIILIYIYVMKLASSIENILYTIYIDLFLVITI